MVNKETSLFFYTKAFTTTFQNTLVKYFLAVTVSFAILIIRDFLETTAIKSFLTDKERHFL